MGIRQELIDIVNNFDVEVSQDFIDYRDGEWEKRTYSEHKPNMNALVFEYYLIKNGLIEESSNWRNDGIYKDHKIDFKRISSGGYWNIMDSKKVQQILESEQRNQVDILLFYKQYVTRNGRKVNDNFDVLIEGDKIKFEFVATGSPSKILRYVKPSFKQKNGYYVRMDELVNNGFGSLQTT